MRSRRIHFRRRALRGTDARFRPSVQLARLIDRITARLAEHRAAADHRQFGEPLPRARKAIPLGDICRRIGTAKEMPAIPCRFQIALHRGTSSSPPGHAMKSIEGGSSSGGGLRSETGAQRAFRADNQAAHARDWNLSFADLPVDLSLVQAEVLGNRLHAEQKIGGEIRFNVGRHKMLRLIRSMTFYTQWNRSR